MVLDQSNLPIFTWTPTYQQAGTYNTTFTVTDGTSSDTKTITITSSFIDTDHNGLPDTWEKQYFGVTGQDPNADPDKDGLTNIEESKAGTDPTVNSNIALGKTYTMDPAPNYGPTGDSNGGNDSTDLTDGVEAPPAAMGIWYLPEAVGWLNADRIITTIDLGQDLPITAITYSTCARIDDVSERAFAAFNVDPLPVSTNADDPFHDDWAGSSQHIEKGEAACVWDLGRA